MKAWPVLLLLWSCGDKDDTETPEEADSSGHFDTDTDTEQPDADEDGFGEDEDCDDTDAAINPGAVEECDDIDNNCDGQIDEGALESWFPDVDGDGYGDQDAGTEGCTQPPGTISAGGDCDDTDAATSPAVVEDCGDSTDNDCDGLIDCEDGGCSTEVTCYESDCGDEIDNDSNGLTDCDDDGCWGVEHCAIDVRVTLEGGAGRQHVTAGLMWSDSAHLYIDSAYGRLYAGGAVSGACTWSRSMHFGATASTLGGSVYLGVGDRGAFNIDGDCGISSSGFFNVLPYLGPWEYLEGSTSAVRFSRPIATWSTVLKQWSYMDIPWYLGTELTTSYNMGDSSVIHHTSWKAFNLQPASFSRTLP